MYNKKMDLKYYLTLLLMIIIGFWMGMAFTFETVFQELENHNIKIEYFNECYH